MSLEDINRYTNDEDPELAIADTCFLSTRENSHGLIITPEVLRECAPTILGKFLVGNMNWTNTDTLAHESKPQIFGYFPTDQEIRFVEKDGYLLARAYAVISKIYATEYYEIFKKDNFRNTSVEMLTVTEEDSKVVKNFTICGLTSLGRQINGSCKDANIEVVRFSEQEAEEYYNRSKSIWDDDVSKGETVLMSKEKQNEDIVMEEQKDEKLGCGEQEAMSEEEKTEEPTSDDKEEKMAEPTNEEEPKEDSKEEETKASEEEVKAGCGGKDKMEESEEDEHDDDDDAEEDDKEEKMAELEAKLAEKDAELSEKNDTIAKMQEQIDELVKFKEEREDIDKMSVVTTTLAQVKDHMPEADYSKFEASGKACKLEEVNAWRNEVLANVATILMSEEREDGITPMGLSEHVEEHKGLWD